MGKVMAMLFDLDGVVMDTEGQYTEFWDRMGQEYLGIDNFCASIKGQTLVQISGAYFKGKEQELKEIVARLDETERNMKYEFIPGADSFLELIRSKGIRTALVTSSNAKKMQNIYDRYPQFKSLFDAILTSESFTRSKPDPECFIKGMQLLGAGPDSTLVFEDSIHGLTAARGSGAVTVGLATTNPRSVVSTMSDYVLDNFLDYEVLRPVCPQLF